ncbi:hypothetical protein ACJMK2_018947 [Sinanodonta woodiana]|uniref:phosphatidylinositol-3,4,5-trisphosphate 5-phosphatase n=1 Tax=Sinanodonta woodiana TaxID=1069815 RepID=A0ABD3UIC4_SINWO
MSGTFFHKGISRMQSEEFLLKAGDDGSFLVRDSETLPGAYVLCLFFQNKVHQYRILPGPDNKLFVQAESGATQRGYIDLTELISEYVRKGSQNGLACALQFPIAPDDKGDTDEEDDDDDFEVPPPPVTPQEKKQQNDPVTFDILKNFSRLDLSRCDGAFVTALKKYVDDGFQQDSTAFKNGETDLSAFKSLMESASKGLKRELDNFMMNIEICNEIFKMTQTTEQKTLSIGDIPRVSDKDIHAMLESMTRCRTEIMALEQKAEGVLQRSVIPSEYVYVDAFAMSNHTPQQVTTSPFLSSKYRPYIPQSKFEVKQVRQCKATKLTLTVDIQVGKYSILKATSKDNLDQKTVTHDKINHLIKSTKDKSSLDVLIDGKKKKTYLFENPQARENFCFQIMQMKNMNSTESEIDQISIFVGTWNMADTTSNYPLTTWLKCSGAGKSRDRVLGVIPHDLYVIGTQETAMTEKDWVNTLKAGLKASVMVDMELLEVCSLWGMRIVILVKPEHKKSISRIQRSSVRTGIANALGNKGAVAISFYFRGTSLCFINTHLTSGDERCNRRNQNYRDIVKGLSLGQKHLDLFDVTNQFHHVFWLGDLNYRTEEQIQVLLQKIQEKNLISLLEKDQLKRVQREKVAFCGFNEAEITFFPTYRLERNVPGYKYAWRKIKKTGERINSPSWCDRVLWRSYPGVFIENVAYGSAESILSSDHRPVFSSFNVGIMSEFVQNRGSLIEAGTFTITFHFIEAQVKTSCRQEFQLEFHSTCLTDLYVSQRNCNFNENQSCFYTCPVWEESLLPKMKPLFSDQEFLEEQHILVAVRSFCTDKESYGECVLPLKDMFGPYSKEFSYVLSHYGEETGFIKGKMHVQTSDKRANFSRHHSKKSYEVVTLDTEYHDPEIFFSDIIKHENSLDTTLSKFVVNTDSTVKPSMPLITLLNPEEVNGDYHEIEFILQESPPIDKKLHKLISIDERPPQPLPGGGLEIKPTSSTYETIQPYLPPRRSVPVMGHNYRQGNPELRTPSAPPRPLTRPPSELPPPLPEKKSFRGDIISRPRTLQEWLTGLSLGVYIDYFFCNGWDDIKFIADLSRKDLEDMGIKNRDHIDRILAGAKELKQAR